MTAIKTKSWLYFGLAVVCILIIAFDLYLAAVPRRPKADLTEFAARFKHGKVYFVALNQEVDIGTNNYFRDDGAVDDLDEHSRSLRLELTRLNILPIEETDKIQADPGDFVDGLSFTVNLQGKKFIIIFYRGKNQNQAEILAEKAHEETHALIRFGKIEMVKEFLKNKNISTEYTQEELYKLCGLDPNNKRHVAIFSAAILNKEAARGEFLAQKMQKLFLTTE